MREARHKGYILYGSTYMTLEKANTTGTEKNSVTEVVASDCSGEKVNENGGRMIIWIMELFYMLIVALIIQPYSFVKIQRTVHQKGEKRAM